ncbi:MAG: hypothetical protein WCT12_25530, partial [Verrucomicrobiota bacterium]
MRTFNALEEKETKQMKTMTGWFAVVMVGVMAAVAAPPTYVHCVGDEDGVCTTACSGKSCASGSEAIFRCSCCTTLAHTTT